VVKVRGTGIDRASRTRFFSLPPAPRKMYRAAFSIDSIAAT
jgi:hypothetical protein